MISNILLAAGLRGMLNTISSDYLIPIFIFINIIALIGGLAKNWKAINDNSGTGMRKTGFINIAYIVGYCLAGTAVIAACLAQIRSISITI